jgi:hypothetical protein
MEMTEATIELIPSFMRKLRSEFFDPSITAEFSSRLEALAERLDRRRHVGTMICSRKGHHEFRLKHLWKKPGGRMQANYVCYICLRWYGEQ